MDRESWLVKLPGDTAIEVRIVGRGNLGPWLGPECGAVGDLGWLSARLLDNRDRHGHVPGLGLDDPLERVALGVVPGIVHQMEQHARASPRCIGQRDRRYRERSFAIRRPAKRFLAAGAARGHIDPIGDHEGRVEPDSKLADEGCLLAILALLDAIQKGLGSRARDGAKRLDQLVAAHADAVVLDGELALVGIDADGDPRRRILAEQAWIGDRLVPQPLAGIGGVRDQLAQEHLFLGINRVHHHVQELGNIRFEGAAFAFCFIGYGHQSIPRQMR